MMDMFGLAVASEGKAQLYQRRAGSKVVER